jgi:hypothetical protein
MSVRNNALTSRSPLCRRVDRWRVALTTALVAGFAVAGPVVDVLAANATFRALHASARSAGESPDVDRMTLIAVAVGTAAMTALAAGLLAAVVLLHRRLDRRCSRLWEREWRAVAPRWTRSY